MQHYLPFVCVTATQLGSHPLTTTLSCDIPSRHLGRLWYLEHVLNAGQLQHEPSAMLEILGSEVSYKQPHLDEMGTELLRGFHLSERLSGTPVGIPGAISCARDWCKWWREPEFQNEIWHPNISQNFCERQIRFGAENTVSSDLGLKTLTVKPHTYFWIQKFWCVISLVFLRK